MATGQDTRSIGELLRDLGSNTADLIRQGFCQVSRQQVPPVLG